jgi:hypothetical protein
MSAAAGLKQVLTRLPLAAEANWYLRNPQHRVFSRFNLELLNEQLPGMVAEVAPYLATPAKEGKVFLFASFHSWIIHTVLCGLVLRGLGYDVRLAYLPYSDFNKPVSRYDLRRQDLYTRHVLGKARPALKCTSFLGLKPVADLPRELAEAVERVTVLDAQYVLQREDIRGDEPITRLRRERNLAAARAALTHFKKERPDTVVVPNGMIQEYAAVYETARFMSIKAVTYEFGEHNQRTWLGQDRLVIHHVTDELWETRKERILDDRQRLWLRDFLARRGSLDTGTEFAHLWQKASSQGGTRVRELLGLDERPVILLPTNVLGDSATLGLNLFTRSMTEWLQRLIPFLAERPDVQVVVRIHPAETWTVGPSVAELIHQVLPHIPPHIHLVGSTEKVNTYDLMEIADLALVYTTTAGLEMATRGIPVLVSGRAHYRKKGFTLDAENWEQYFAALEKALAGLPRLRLTEAERERALNYAYCFFAEYPLPFPWHLEKLKPDLEQWPIRRVLGSEGREKFESTFRSLAGAPRS